MGVEQAHDVAWDLLLRYSRVLDLPVAECPASYGAPAVRALVDLNESNYRRYMCGMLVTAAGQLIPFGEHLSPDNLKSGLAAQFIPLRSQARNPFGDLDQDDWQHIHLMLEFTSAQSAANLLNDRGAPGVTPRLFGPDGAPKFEERVAGLRYGDVIDAMELTRPFGENVRASFLASLDPEAKALATLGQHVVPRLYNAMVFVGKEQPDREALYVRQACRQFPSLPHLVATAGNGRTSDRSSIRALLKDIGAGRSLRREALPKFIGESDVGVSAGRITGYLQGRSLESVWAAGRYHARSHFHDLLPFLATARQEPADRESLRVLEALPAVFGRQNGIFRQRLSEVILKGWDQLPSQHDLIHVLDFEAWLVRRIKGLRDTTAYAPIVGGLQQKGFNWWLRTAARWGQTLHRRASQPSRENPGWLPMLRSPHVECEGLLVVELTTANQLREEGERMAHCVATYDQACLENRCRIFSVRNAEGVSFATLEIAASKRRDVPFVQAQLRGFADGAAVEQVAAAATEFLRQINAPYCRWLSREAELIGSEGRPTLRELKWPVGDLARVMLDEADLMPVSRERLRELLVPLATPAPSMAIPEMRM